MVDHVYLIPLLPLLSGLLVFFLGRWLPRQGIWLSILATAASLVCSIDLFLRWGDGTLKLPWDRPWPWFSAGIYPLDWGILIDGPALVMLLVVCTVSLAVQIYSIGYMRDAPRIRQFYAYLSLFTFSMLGLVLANNYLQFFVGWEIMGACSYLLISFEYERDAAAAAGIKAFLTTRLGDLGFYAGLLTTFLTIGSFNFFQIQARLHEGTVSPNIAFLIAMMFFCGAIGKSAQFPLFTWLPDAMEGPTPVSALIHAATMVAAGVFLVARSYPFFIFVPKSLEVVAWVGGSTAILAATMAMTANDVKRVLAYSTISQLGYMMMGMGLMGYTAGLFHLTTHAAFKSLLFLGAGSVIHSVHTNDMWKMGSLSKQMITTFMTFLIGAAALAGIWPLAGFYSKEMILGIAFATRHYALFGIGCVTAFLTAFYMTRAVALIFLGEPRERDRFARAHDSPWTMTVPLMILAVLSFFVGRVMISSGMLERLLSWPGTPEVVESHVVTMFAVFSAASGIFLGWLIYLSRSVRPDSVAKAFAPFYKLFVNKWFFDEIYAFLFVRPVEWLARAAAWFDDQVIDRTGVTVSKWVAHQLNALEKGYHKKWWKYQ